MPDLVSKKTRYEFREHLVGFSVLREIEMHFASAGVECNHEHQPRCSGARRTLVEQYYQSVRWTEWRDVRKVLQAYENVLAAAPADEVERLSRWLERDGFAYREGRILAAAGVSLLQEVKSVASELDAGQLAQQIQRIEEAIHSDPALAVGSAKELVETSCQTMLAELGEEPPRNEDLPQVVKRVLRKLSLLPEDVPESAKGAKAIRRTLSNLASLVQGIVEVRNLYGTGHGKEGRMRGLEPRHAKLAVGAAVTLVTFLFDTYRQREKKSAD